MQESQPGVCAQEAHAVEVRHVDDLEQDLPICLDIRRRVLHGDVMEELCKRKGIAQKEVKLPPVGDARDVECEHFLAYIAERDQEGAEESAGHDRRQGVHIKYVATMRAFVHKSAREKGLYFIDDACVLTPDERCGIRECARAGISNKDEDLYVYYGRMSQVAVLKELRGHGVGRLLMHAGERYLKEKYGVHMIKMHAYCPALGFYERIGYQRVADPQEHGDVDTVDIAKEL